MSTFEDLIVSLLPDEFAEKMGILHKEDKFVSALDFNACTLRSKILDFRSGLFDLDGQYPDLTFSWSSKLKLDSFKKHPYAHDYVAISTLRGYQSFSISRSSFMVTLISSLFLEEIFDEDEDDLFYYCLCSVNLLSYFFYFQIKIPPTPYKKEGFNRYFQFFFNFFEKILQKILPDFSKERFNDLKVKFLEQYELFQFLFVYYYRVSNMFACYSGVLDNHDNLDRMIYYFGEMYEELKVFTNDQRKKDSVSPEFFDYEEDLLGKIGPYDLLLKGLFVNVKTKTFVRTFVNILYDKKEISDMIKEFSKKNNAEMIFKILDVEPFKRNFVYGLREYFSVIFRGEMTREEEKMFDEFQDQLEALDGDLEKLKKMKIKIPKRIKEESQLFDQFLDFYLCLMSEKWIASTDTGELRFFSPALLNKLCGDIISEQDYLYDRKLLETLCQEFYYGRSFFDRMECSIKEKKYQEQTRYSLSLFLVFQISIKSLTCLFQDFSSGKRVCSDPRLWKWLKDEKGMLISGFLKESDREVLQHYLSFLLPGNLRDFFIEKNKEYYRCLFPHQISNMRNAWYSLEFWVYYESRVLFDKVFDLRNKSLFEQTKRLADFRKTIFGNLFFAYYLKYKLQKEEYLETIVNFILRSGGYSGNSQVKKDKALKYLYQLLDYFETPFSYLMEQKENASFCKLLFDFLKQGGQIEYNDPVAFWFKSAFIKMGYFNGSLLIPF